MRKLAILGNKARSTFAAVAKVYTVSIDDVPVHCGVLDTPEPVFEPNAPGNEHMVLLRVKAFSLNYRDKNRIFTMMLKGRDDGYYVVGSEFAGVVLETGPAVTGFATGDRVMGNNSYPSSGWPGVIPGVPTNHGSKELLVLHQAKLMKVPDGMPDAVAASFSIGAQTVYSIIRRLGIGTDAAAPGAGTNILVTSAKSNTSLFAIHALRKYGISLYATSGTDRFAAELKTIGVTELAVIGRETPFFEHPILREVAREGGFRYVIDPFSDLHLARALDVMAVGGRYVTCGFYDQYLHMIGKPPLPVGPNTSRVLPTMVLKNLEVLGNCAGTTEDLANALCDYTAGSLGVTIDSVWSYGQVAEFFTRTYNAPDRFGKVVYQYE